MNGKVTTAPLKSNSASSAEQSKNSKTDTNKNSKKVPSAMGKFSSVPSSSFEKKRSDMYDKAPINKMTKR